MTGSANPQRGTGPSLAWEKCRGAWRWLFGTAESATESPLGRRGEHAAERHLRRLGYTILARQWRCSQGEVDLIAVDRQTVVFVEVKTRHGHQAGHPLESITPQQQRRLCRSALAFLRRHGLLERPARFDVIGITWPPESKRPGLQHVRGAFEPTERWQMFA